MMGPSGPSAAHTICGTVYGGPVMLPLCKRPLHITKVGCPSYQTRDNLAKHPFLQPFRALCFSHRAAGLLVLCPPRIHAYTRANSAWAQPPRCARGPTTHPVLLLRSRLHLRLRLLLSRHRRRRRHRSTHVQVLLSASRICAHAKGHRHARAAAAGVRALEQPRQHRLRTAACRGWPAQPFYSWSTAADTRIVRALESTV